MSGIKDMHFGSATPIPDIDILRASEFMKVRPFRHLEKHHFHLDTIPEPPILQIQPW